MGQQSLNVCHERARLVGTIGARGMPLRDRTGTDPAVAASDGDPGCPAPVAGKVLRISPVHAGRSFEIVPLCALVVEARPAVKAAVRIEPR